MAAVLFAGESGPQMGRSVEKQVRWFWRLVMMPVLFGLVGASVDFATIERGIIPKSCAIIIAGANPCALPCPPGLTCWHSHMSCTLACLPESTCWSAGWAV